MNKAVLDASAIMAWLQREPGSQSLLGVCSGSLVSAVNVAEIHTRLVGSGTPEAISWRQIQYLGCESQPFDDVQARAAGALVSITRPFGLSLGDRACLALAMERGAKVYTADRVWQSLAGQLGIEIAVIR